MRIKYESKTYSYFFLAILLSVGLLFSSNCVNITLFDNVYSQKIDNASSLNSSLNSINNLQDGSSSSQIKQQQQQISKKIPLNHYENRQLGVSLKYPSNFLIDESNSNNTLRQISFYPVNVGSVNPENYIQWMDVFVQTLGTAQQQQQQQQPLSSLSNSNSLSPLLSANNNNNNNNFLASYSLNLANNIQQGNADITIVGSSTNTTLSGYPAYKLITTSYIGNSAITDVLISTIVNNTIYSIDYHIPSSSSNYANSLSDASKIIQSFKILSPVSSESTTAEGMAETRQQLSSSSSSASNVISNNKNLNSNLSNSNSALIPLLSSLLSSLKIDDIANNSTNTVNSLKNSISNSLNDALSNPKNVIDKSISGSSSILQNPPPIPLLTSPSDLSSLSSDTVKKTCSIPFVSTVCNEIKNSLDNNNNNNNINNIGKTNPSSSNSNNLTNNIAGSGNNSSISTGSGNTTINNNNRLSTTTNDLTGSIGKGGNNIGIGSSINNSKLDNTAIPKNNTDNLLVNHDKNNTLAKILNSLLNTNNTNNSSLSFNKSKPLNDILLLENLIKYLNFSSSISPGPLPPQQPIPVNSSSSLSNPLPRNIIQP